MHHLGIPQSETEISAPIRKFQSPCAVLETCECQPAWMARVKYPRFKANDRWFSQVDDT